MARSWSVTPPSGGTPRVGFWGCDRLVSEPLVIENLVLIWENVLLKPDYNQYSALNDPQRRFAPRARLDILGNKVYVYCLYARTISNFARIMFRYT